MVLRVLLRSKPVVSPARRKRTPPLRHEMSEAFGNADICCRATGWAISTHSGRSEMAQCGAVVTLRVSASI